MKFNDFQDFGKIMIRKPAYSYQILFDGKGNTKDLNVLLADYIEEDQFLEAIFWSSIPLYQTILNSKKQELSGKKQNRINLTLKKYLIRASTRPTPYGTFAGTTIQNLYDNNNYKNFFSGKKVRLNVNIIRKISKSLENNKDVFPKINFKINNSVYVFNNQFRYLEVSQNGKNTSQISSINRNNVLNFIYSKKWRKKITFNNLFTELSTFFEREELMAFFQELVDSGFLISELELSQTDRDELKYIRKFIEKEEFKKSKEITKYKTLLKNITNYITILENSSAGEFYINDYKNIKNLFEKLNISINDEQLFHVDVLNGNDSNFEISNKNKRNLYEAISILSKLIPKSSSQSQIQIKNFIKLFSEKYESDSVPIMEALDPEIGIGFPANTNIGHFFNNEILNFKGKSNSEQCENTNSISNWLIDKIENLSVDEKEINILQNDLQEFPSRTSSLPNTFNIVGQIISQEKILLQSAGGTHANSLLSRFAYMNKDIESLCNNISEFEKEVSQDVLFAEIVWVPDHKVANVTRKLTSKDYEIAIYYQSSLSVENQIYLDDILISIEDNELILKSKKLNKRIIPRLSSAHNYLSTNNPIYNFLCSLQNHKSTDLCLIPNFAQNKKRFFPRIIYKNIILHPCYWILQESDIKTINNSQISIEELNRFLDKWKVAKYVMLSQGDNELFLDISNVTYLNILLDEISKNHKIIVLKEWLYPINTNSNTFVNQFILPIRKLKPVSHKKLSPNLPTEQKKSFHPGGEWVYFKIYCDANCSDIILKKINSQVLKKFGENGIINRWFFIRFTDPHYHLRIRIKSISTEFIGEIIQSLNLTLNLYIKRNIVWNTKIDTYQPENSRYLASDIENAEYVFFKDSDLFLKISIKKEFQENEDIRFFSVIKNIDYWLDLFCLNLKEKRDFCEKMKSLFAKEQSDDFILQIENLYRRKIDLMEIFLKSKKFVNLFKSRNQHLSEIDIDISNLDDFIHMSINRWFITNQRSWEFAAYYFCFRNYNKNLHSSTKINEVINPQ